MKIGIKFLGDELEARVGELAGQADGSVLLRYGDTVVLSAVVSSKSAVLTTDFLPLTVEFREKSYAVGNIPGGFYKREGKPTEREIIANTRHQGILTLKEDAVVKIINGLTSYDEVLRVVEL